MTGVSLGKCSKVRGSTWFAYLHIAWFAFWIVLGVEAYPYGLLTMIVSLEAIFLSTFAFGSGLAGLGGGTYC